MKTYIITEKDIERLKDALDYNADSWFHPGKVDEWEESLIPQEIIDNSKYKPIEEHPKELKISTYWNTGHNVSYLREGLPHDHEENLYNWFTKTYPDLNPSFYDIKIPQRTKL